MSDSLPNPRRRTLTIRLKLLLIATGIFAGIALLEITLRVTGVSHPVPYAPDPWCGSRLQSNFRGYWTKEGRAVFTTNSMGFRDKPHSLQKPAGTKRIAVLGDSYIEALQVSDGHIFARCLEAELARQMPVSSGTVEVLSFGVSGWGTAQELQALRHYVWQFDPDVVVLAFLPGNDVRNNWKPLEPMQCRPFFRQQDNQLLLDDSFLTHPDFVKAGQSSTQWKNWIINSSRVVQLTRALRDAAGGHASAPSEVNTTMPPPNTATEAGLEDTSIVAPITADWVQAWELTDRLILQMADEVRERDRTFAVMTIPAAVQVDPDPAVRSALQRQLHVSDLDYAERRVAGLADHHHFLHIPLAQEMRSAAEREQTYLHGFANTRFGTGHWNENGHLKAARVAATALAPVMGTP